MKEGSNGNTRSTEGKKTGAGAEAAEGIHGAKGDSTAESRSQVGKASPGRSASDRDEPAGSEPLTAEGQHVSGYGGKGGQPKTDSSRELKSDPEEGIQD